MTIDHQKVWNTMNELEMVSSKISSAREILNSAIDALEDHKLEKTETLMYAADEFLQYYLQEFDAKFKDAWKETVVKINQSETKLSCDKDNLTPECKSAWNSFWEENYYPEEYKGSTVSSVSDDTTYGHNDMESLRYTDEEMNAMCDKATSSEKHSESYYDYTRNDYTRPNPFDKVVKWRLPIEEVKDSDTDETEYFITFPDDLLEASNLKPGDDVEWVDRNDGSFLLRKVIKSLGMDEC
jgi:hypothetical protein